MNIKIPKLNFTKKNIIGFIFVFVFIAAGTLLYKNFIAKGANYSWLQTDWSGGASTTAIARHASDQTGWTKYYSKDALLSTSTAGQLTLASSTASTTDTTTADFSGASSTSNVYVSSNSVYLKKPDGLACSSVAECSSGLCNESCGVPSVGDTYQGGTVFYVSGGHGLIAMTSDTSASAQWGCYGTTITGADSTTDGAQNTIDIVAGCSPAGIAARLCSDLSSGGYTDWYLPAKDQLNTMYSLRMIIGGFASYYYWSSTEVNSSNAWYGYFPTGYQGSNYEKSYGFFVRCIRSF